MGIEYLGLFLLPIWCLVLLAAGKSNFVTNDDSRTFLGRFGAIPYIVWVFNPVWIFCLFIIYGLIQGMFGPGVPTYIRVIIIGWHVILVLALVFKKIREIGLGLLAFIIPLSVIFMALWEVSGDATTIDSVTIDSTTINPFLPGDPLDILEP